jgi:hypothetical protein
MPYVAEVEVDDEEVELVVADVVVVLRVGGVEETSVSAPPVIESVHPVRKMVETWRVRLPEAVPPNLRAVS